MSVSEIVTGPWKPVNSKADFVFRYCLGEFGNRAPTWDTLEAYLADGYEGLMHLRNRIAGAQTWYNLSGPTAVNGAWQQALAAGFGPHHLYLSSMAPTEHTTLQGEVQQTTAGLALYYTTVRKPMRDALKEKADQVYGLLAVSLLKEHLCPNSWEWLNVLLERYEGHVVEFSAYSTEWGTVPGHNCVIWEVRNY